MPFKNLNQDNKSSQKKARMEIKTRAESLALAISRAPQAISTTTHNVANVFAEDFGRDKFLKAMRLCKVPKITEILQVYDNLAESERRSISFDQLCEQVGFPPDKLVGESMAALSIHGNKVIQGILNEEFPAVLRAGMQKASTPDGLEDRRMAYQMRGLMPFDRGNEININNIINPKGTPKFEDAPDAAPSFMSDIIDGEVSEKE